MVGVMPVTARMARPSAVAVAAVNCVHSPGVSAGRSRMENHKPLPAGEDLTAQGIGSVVIGDVVEQKGGAAAGSLRDSDYGAELHIPMDFPVNLGEFVGVAERIDPAA